MLSSDQPPPKLSYRYEKTADSLSLRQKMMPGAGVAVVGFVLFFWLTGWVYGCLVLTMQIIEDPSVFKICFAVPFWAAFFAVVAVLLYLMFGRQTLRLDGDGLAVEYHILVRTESRRVRLADVGRFRVKKHQNAKTVSYSIKVKTDGKPIVLWVKNGDEAKWLADELNRTLAELRGDEPAAKAPAQPVETPLNALPRHLDPPGDCRWTMHTDCDSATFRRRGNYSALAIAGTTFVTLFWSFPVFMGNFILWGFQPGGPEFLTAGWWFLFVFLIPFNLLGLGFFLSWFSLIAAFFQRTRWRISRGEAVCRTTWLGVGSTRRYSLENCRKTAIRPWNAKPGGCAGLTPDFGLETGDRRLVFVDSEGRTLFEIDDLTRGEARWMADNVLGYR